MASFSERMLAAKRTKRENLARLLVEACFEGEQQTSAVLEEIEQVFEVAVESALWLWFDELLPRHFGPGATARYGYPERTKGYMVGKYVGGPRHMMGGRLSRWNFPRDIAYRMASATKQNSSGTAPDPHPLEFTGESKARMTSAPERYPRIQRIKDGYKGSMVISAPAYIRSEDIQALLRDTPEDLALMLGRFQDVVRGSFGG